MYRTEAVPAANPSSPSYNNWEGGGISVDFKNTFELIDSFPKYPSMAGFTIFKHIFLTQETYLQNILQGG
jgi:hypothetical protein